MKPEYIVQLIVEELRRAESIHPIWPTNIFEALAVIHEEEGEIAKAVNQYYWDNASDEEIRKEVIQTAAMCIRFLQHWGEYDARRTSQTENRQSSEEA